MLPCTQIDNIKNLISKTEKIDQLERHVIKQTVQYNFICKEISFIRQIIFWAGTSFIIILVGYLLYSLSGYGG